MIIPRSLAEILFPGESAVGKLLKTDNQFFLDETRGEVTVAGVYEDFPTNTQLGNDLYLTIGDIQKGLYGGANFVCYLLLDDESNAQAVADEFNTHFDFAPHGDWLTPIELVPLTSIYFRNEGNIYKSGSRSQLLLLIAIAILILGIGLINFTNFYVALTPLRIRSVNLQKILGSSTRRLRIAKRLCIDHRLLAAKRAKLTRKSLRQYQVDRRRHQERLNTHVQQTANRRGRIVRMQRAQNHVPRQCRFNCDFRRLEVSNKSLSSFRFFRMLEIKSLSVIVSV